MGDDKQNVPQPKSDRWIVFAMRMCAVAWVGALFGEVLPVGPLKNLCILVGSHAAVIGLLTCFIGWPARGNFSYLVLMVATAVPSVWYGFAVRNVAVQRGWLKPTSSLSHDAEDPDSLRESSRSRSRG